MHEVAKIEALVHFHFKVDPESLTDDELGKLWGRLKFAFKVDELRYQTGEK